MAPRTPAAPASDGPEPTLDAADDAFVCRFDESMADATQRAGSLFGCGPGNSRCCRGPFPINLLDARRLWRGMTALASRDPARAEAVFRTSGTTRGEGERGRHFVRALDLYRGSLLPNFRAHLFPEGGGLPVLALLPHPKIASDSSLSFMVGEVTEALSGGRGEFFVDPRTGVRTAAFDQALKAAEGAGEPVLLAGTALAFSHWLDTVEREGWRYRLPAGSRIMETGGYKGREKALPREELYAGLEGSFGVPPERMVNEYGMTELLSQFYEPVMTVGSEATRLLDDASGSLGMEGGIGLAERHHRGPPWVRTRALHPLTLDPVPEGEVGILAHLDLANLGSVSAVLTEDLGRLVPGGFRLQGRSPGAEPRGCSLAMEDFLVGVKGGIDGL